MAKMSISCIADVEWLLGFVGPYLAFDTLKIVIAFNYRCDSRLDLSLFAVSHYGKSQIYQHSSHIGVKLFI